MIKELITSVRRDSDMPNEKPTRPESESKRKAKAMPPERLWPVLDEFCGDYAFCAETLHGHPFTSPRVLAQLILMGWRCSADPIEERTNNFHD